MLLASSHCQHISRSRLSAILRTLGVIVLMLSCMGCWQEVRYEPGDSAASAPRVVDETEEPTQEIVVPPAPEVLLGENDSDAVAVEVVPDPVFEGGLSPSAEANSPGAGLTALAAWRMSSGWSMAVALQAKGRDAAGFSDRLEMARLEAEMLGVDLPKLPFHEAGADRLSENLTFLLEEAGPRLADELSKQHGAEHAALAELATKTHILLLCYTPNSMRLEPVIAAIRQAAVSSGLPESVWRELVDLLAERADFKQVKAAIFQLHQRAVAFLNGSSG